MTDTHSLQVPGARLYYETRGTGPLLLVFGSPMSSPNFAALADELASDHTVVTFDPRGIAKSTIDNADQDSTPDLRADDVAAILDDLGAESADAFGTSGGAVTGLALVERHPGRIRTLIAHEPPVLELLPDAAAHRANTDDIVATYHRDGLGPAFAKFMGVAGLDEETQGPPPQMSEQDALDGARFLSHELQATTRFVPNIHALTTSTTRVVIGVGRDSTGQLTEQTSLALAEELGERVTHMPGDHVAFLVDPAGFAASVREILAGGH
ncbi:alpha/beta hydrolase [Glaciihabitans arcticus]|uniref:Alpha/beta hydrolase n=1 Tax=Glaciihabitans arcticus TaxID=2668039 RepID=A0A4Q9GUP6_9MICO|nr:alpha/beta hydrolase [Glaciihabitans arcticus]TBN56293.1 alpha/beta hydrolase [Glaciihabitans arcticus]